MNNAEVINLICIQPAISQKNPKSVYSKQINAKPGQIKISLLGMTLFATMCPRGKTMAVTVQCVPPSSLTSFTHQNPRWDVLCCQWFVCDIFRLLFGS